MKKEIRVLGFDDAPFEKGQETVLVIGTFFRGGEALDGVLSTTVEVDGDDATVKIIELVNSSKFKSQVQVILLDGIAFGGFNVVNIGSIFKYTGIPVIVVVRIMPDFEALQKALWKLGMEQKYTLMEKAGTPREIQVQEGKIYTQVAGIDFKEAEEVLKICCTRSHIPEAIRVAHLIGAGIVKGESRGRA